MTRRQRKATHCNKGHEWTEENTYRYHDAKGGRRRKCRRCTLDRLQRERDARAKRPKTQRVYAAQAARQTANAEAILQLRALREIAMPWDVPAIDEKLAELRQEVRP